MSTKSHPVILRRRQVQERTGLSCSGIYARLDPNKPGYDPTLPRQISLGHGARAVGWLEHEVTSWLEAQIAKSRAAGG